MSQIFYEIIVQKDGSLKAPKELSAKEKLDLLELRFAHRLCEGNVKGLYHLQRKIEKAKDEYQFERTKDRIEHKILDQLLFCLFSPPNSPKYVPSKR